MGEVVSLGPVVRFGAENGWGLAHDEYKHTFNCGNCGIKLTVFIKNGHGADNKYSLECCFCHCSTYPKKDVDNEDDSWEGIFGIGPDG